MHSLVTWLLAAMTAWVPVTGSEIDRYEAIAFDIVQVAGEAPLYEDETGVARTAILMASIASFESQFAADVDSGKRKGDGGAAHCLMQVHLRKGEDVTDRKDCFRVALLRIHESFNMCRGLPIADRLSGYTRGTCAKNKESELRVNRALAWWKSHQFFAGVD